jgi:predicted permease
VRAFVTLAPPVLPRMDEIGIDAGVLFFTLGIAFAAGVLFGLPPLLHARPAGERAALAEEGGRSAGGRFGRRAGAALVVTEVALAVILLVGAGLLIKSLLRLYQQDLGLVAERVVSFDVALPEARYGSDAALRGFYRESLERLRRLPGVEAAGAIDLLPLYRFGNNGYFDVEGKALWEHDRGPLAEMRVVAGDYLEVMGIPLLRGRFFTPRDDADAPQVIVVNRALAERCWPGEDPIGRHLVFDSDDRREVIGVVGDVRSYAPHLEPEMEVLRPLGQEARGAMTVALRARTPDPAALLASVRSEMAQVDPDQPLASVQTMEEVVSGALARPRLLSTLTAGLAAVAALLAFLGVYGLVAWTVSQRRREMGIRIAVGASRGEVLRQVLGEGLRLGLTGIGLGTLAALALSRGMTALLYQVAPSDLPLLAGTAAGVLLATVAASLLPALAATRIDPAVVLRSI